MTETFHNNLTEAKLNPQQLRNITMNSTGNSHPTEEDLLSTKQWFLNQKDGLTEETLALFYRINIQKSLLSQSNDTKNGSVGNYLSHHNEADVKKKLEGLVDKFIPRLNLGDKMEGTLSEIESSIGEPITPEKLTNAIAKYIKEHMKYDLLVALQCVVPNIMEVVSATSREGSRIKLDKQLQEVKSNPIFQFNQQYTSQLIDFLKNKQKYLGKLDSPESIFIKDFLVVLNNPKNTPEKTKEFVISRLMTMEPLQVSSIVKFLLGFAEMGKIEDRDVGTLLLEYRVGVCRHYSMMAKKIYTAIKERNPENTSLQESELLYVLNPAISHAYNVLLFEDQKGVTKKIYLDITSYLIGNDLYPDNSKKDQILEKKRKTEIIAKDESQSEKNILT